MMDAPEPEDTTEQETGMGAAPGSILALIEQVREDVAAEGEPLLLPVGAYKNRIALRFDYPEGGFAQLRRALGGQPVGRRRVVKQDDEAELNAMANVMVTCCTGVVEVQDGVPEADWPSIDPSGRDIRIGKQLAALINIDVPSDMNRGVGRFVLRHLYSPRAHKTGMFRGDPTLLADGVAVQDWLDAGGIRADQAMPGE